MISVTWKNFFKMYVFFAETMEEIMKISFRRFIEKVTGSPTILRTCVKYVKLWRFPSSRANTSTTAVDGDFSILFALSFNQYPPHFLQRHSVVFILLFALSFYHYMYTYHFFAAAFSVVTPARATP